MINYFEEYEFSLDRIWFHYLGGLYEGRGLLKWNPNEGFHLDAFLERKGSPISSKIDLDKLGYVDPSEICSIRMKSKSFKYAFAPQVILYGHIELLWEHRLSINLDRVIFFHRMKKENTKLYGSALFKTSGNIILPDNIKSVIMREDQTMPEPRIENELRYDSNYHNISGRFVDKTLDLNFKLSSSKWSKSQCWDWPIAAKDSLSIILGQTVCLLIRNVYRGKQNIEEIRKQREIKTLGLLSLFNLTNLLNKEIFVRLTEFFLENKNKQHAIICRNIFKQLIDANLQNSIQAQELLTSTVLEASLRTFEKKHVKRKKDSWNCQKSLKEFCKNYKLRGWTKYCDYAKKAWTKLRTRNAHPDWLISKYGGLSYNELSKSLDDRIFLSRFYGYMILALAGFVNLKPEFPPPHKEWKPSATLSFKENND